MKNKRKQIFKAKDSLVTQHKLDECLLVLILQGATVLVNLPLKQIYYG